MQTLKLKMKSKPRTKQLWPFIKRKDFYTREFISCCATISIKHWEQQQFYLRASHGWKNKFLGKQHRISTQGFQLNSIKSVGKMIQRLNISSLSKRNKISNLFSSTICLTFNLELWPSKNSTDNNHNSSSSSPNIELCKWCIEVNWISHELSAVLATINSTLVHPFHFLPSCNDKKYKKNILKKSNKHWTYLCGAAFSFTDTSRRPLSGRKARQAIEEDQAHKNPLCFDNQFSIRLIKTSRCRLKAAENYFQKSNYQFLNFFIALIIHFANEFYGFAWCFQSANTASSLANYFPTFTHCQWMSWVSKRELWVSLERFH